MGTAGSGKTQLALAVYRDAVAAGRRPLYVCFNRPLADHMARVVPEGGMVGTYHQLGDRLLRSRGTVIDFTKPGAFAELSTAFAAADPGEGWRFDELIVDEGQDMEGDWVPVLLRLMKPGARAWWLEDPMQNLYARPPAALPGWTVLHADTNYRSPRDILANLNRLLTLDRPVEAGSPIDGSEVEFLSYADPKGLLEQTRGAIDLAIKAGFRKDMIAVVCFRGREGSTVQAFDRLGPYSLRRFTGAYDGEGRPVEAAGAVLVDSVYRFKGRCAPCVVLTEVDFEALGEIETRKLFVGATRATMKLVVVASERAMGVLIGRLEGV